MLEWLKPEGDEEALELVNHVISTVGSNPKVRCFEDRIYLFGDAPLVGIVTTNKEPEEGTIAFRVGDYVYAYTPEGNRAMMNKDNDIDTREAPEYLGDKYFREEMIRRIFNVLPDLEIATDDDLIKLLKLEQ